VRAAAALASGGGPDEQWPRRRRGSLGLVSDTVALGEPARSGRPLVARRAAAPARLPAAVGGGGRPRAARWDGLGEPVLFFFFCSKQKQLPLTTSENVFRPHLKRILQ